MIKKVLIVLVCLGVVMACLGLSISSLSYDNLKSNVESIDITSERLQVDLLTLSVMTYSLDAVIVNFGGDVDGDIYLYNDGYYYLEFSYETVQGDYRIQSLRLSDNEEDARRIAREITRPSRVIIELSDAIGFIEHTTSFDNSFDFEDIFAFFGLFWDAIIFILAILYLPVGFAWILVFFLVDTVLLMLSFLLAAGRFIGLA